MNSDPVAVARDLFAALEEAWNSADGQAFAQPFSDSADFVDIRGVRHRGGRTEVAAGHQAIFDTIYRGSTIRYEVTSARVVGADCILAAIDATLSAPSGPLAGTNQSVITALIAGDDAGWHIESFHNTLVSTQAAPTGVGSR